MSNRKLDLSSGLTLAGALLLLISLFLHWFEPDLTGWNAFEALDLVLAALALGAAAIAAGRAERALPSAARWLPVIAGVAFVIVAVQLIDPPPVAGPEGDRELGAWLALVGTALMVAAAALAAAHVSVVVDVREREPPHRGPGAGHHDEPRRAGGEPP
ncbi:MAG: hypothetical protein H0T43_03055, partial [Solirubrobacterales bacterium]|nr:hypothetical protein [Solirubrobacterales bacterium]